MIKKSNNITNHYFINVYSNDEYADIYSVGAIIEFDDELINKIKRLRHHCEEIGKEFNGTPPTIAMSSYDVTFIDIEFVEREGMEQIVDEGDGCWLQVDKSLELDGVRTEYIELLIDTDGMRFRMVEKHDRIPVYTNTIYFKEDLWESN